MVAITQPTFLPWMGYFDLVDQSDVFVFLDNVQFVKRSWHQRNLIKTNKGLEWLTVPVISKDRYHQKIAEAEIFLTDQFPKKQLKTLIFNYRKTPYFEKYFYGLKEILTNNNRYLAEMNKQIICWVAKEIGINTVFKCSSNFGVEGKRSEILVNICKQINTNNYLTTIGALEYILEDQEIFHNNDIEILFHNYHHPEYQQRYKPFMSYVSIIDLLFNEGPKSLEIIRLGRKPLFVVKDFNK